VRRGGKVTRYEAWCVGGLGRKQLAPTRNPRRVHLCRDKEKRTEESESQGALPTRSEKEMGEGGIRGSLSLAAETATVLTVGRRKGIKKPLR